MSWVTQSIYLMCLAFLAYPGSAFPADNFARQFVCKDSRMPTAVWKMTISPAGLVKEVGSSTVDYFNHVEVTGALISAWSEKNAPTPDSDGSSSMIQLNRQTGLGILRTFWNEKIILRCSKTRQTNCASPGEYSYSGPKTYYDIQLKCSAIVD